MMKFLMPGNSCVADRGRLLSWRALGSFPEARIWKDMSRRTFRTVAILPSEVAALVWEEMALRAFAHTRDPGDVFFCFRM